VNSFAKKTGDFSSLSATDLQVIALGYTMAEKYKLTDKIRKEPPDMMKFMPEIAYNE
jgi:hypothetical protein